MLNLLDDIHNLTDSEVTELARLGSKEVSTQILAACFDELARRVNAWIALRHRPDQDFTSLANQLISVSVLMDVVTVRLTLKFARRFRDPEPHVSKLILLLGDAQNIEGLQFACKTLKGAKWKDQRRLIQDALIRSASLAGADIGELVPLGKDSLSTFAACWFLWRDRNIKLEVHIPQVPSDLIRERYSLVDNSDVSTFFYDEFWSSLYVGFCAHGNDYSLIHPGIGEDDLGWMPQGLTKLVEIARGISEGRLTPTFSAVYAEVVDIVPVPFGTAPERDHAQYRAFKTVLSRIAVDLHFLGTSDRRNTKVSSSELSIARQSAHWSDELWVTRNVKDRIPHLDKDAAAQLLTDESNVLSTKVTEFSERSERWTQLATLALLYGDERQCEFLAHAAECLVGYGWRKDLHALDVLDAIVELGATDPAVTRSRLDSLVPIIEMITEFTDGDETNHVRSELIEVVAKVAPERLPSLYEHHLLVDEHSYADECLVEFAKLMDLDSPEGAALARTFLDDRTLKVLENRAVDDPTARVLLDGQDAFLGRSPNGIDKIKATEEELSEQQKEAAKVNPASFGYKDFTAVVDATEAIHYKGRKEFIKKWLHHWKEQGRASHALRTILSYFETDEKIYRAEEILDEAFLVSLAVEGREAAYQWLVKAHIHRNGWQSYYASEVEVMARLKLAAEHYPDRWLQYIKDTSVPAPYYRRKGYSFVLGYKYLVRFLMLVAQEELANKITTSFVTSLIEEVREQPIPETPWFR
jgi:hypothetical protein